MTFDIEDWDVYYDTENAWGISTYDWTNCLNCGHKISEHWVSTDYWSGDISEGCGGGFREAGEEDHYRVLFECRCREVQ